jgi:hypothetical protein
MPSELSFILFVVPNSRLSNLVRPLTGSSAHASRDGHAVHPPANTNLVHLVHSPMMSVGRLPIFISGLCIRLAPCMKSAGFDEVNTPRRTPFVSWFPTPGFGPEFSA